MSKENIELRSEEFQEIIGTIPHWILRSGITIVFLFLIAALLLVNYLYYPDKVVLRVVITTKETVNNISAPHHGHLKLVTANNTNVREGTTLAYIENAGHYNDILTLSDFLNKISSVLKDKISLQKFPLNYNLHLGELQSDYLKLADKIEQYKRSGYVQGEVRSLALGEEVILIQNLNDQLKKQKDLDSKHLAIIQKNNTSKPEKDADFFEKTYAIQAAISDINTRILTNNIKIRKLLSYRQQKDLYQKNSRTQLLQAIYSSIWKTKNHLDLWKTKYIISSSINGRLYILPATYNNMPITANQLLFKVLPVDTNLIVTSYIPTQNSGKVKPGQDMLIKLDNYPFEEFGMLNAKVEHISLVPINGNYIINARLSNGMISTRNIKMTFKQEMSGTGDIITKNDSFLNKIFYQFRHLLNGKN